MQQSRLFAFHTSNLVTGGKVINQNSLWQLVEHTHHKPHLLQGLGCRAHAASNGASS